MRIIAGTHRGRSLLSPPGRTSRPILDTLKQRLFDMLGERCEGALVADLFAGSGSLGLEALSRGAAEALMVERDRATRAVLEANVRALGFGGRARVLGADSFGLDLAGIGPRDLVFLDPPFADAAGGEGRGTGPLRDLLGRALEPRFLRPGGVLVLRTPVEASIEPPADPSLVLRRRDQGRNRLWIVERRPGS